ncbi:alpha/beta fold hydrolase [Sphingomonas soli]|uniref:alpha/beta fold hydrolase n=1 Tax=Sphingomonas soli TaxID=266127 RepID=UPI001FE21B1C|nr:alpha/beta hydrolase [Sphingomonas soli]
MPRDATISYWAARDGWPIRRFDWPADAARGSILLIGGRGDIFEKYLEAFEHWRLQGWSVTALDLRGHGGSGRASESELVGHTESFAALVDDLADFWRDWRGGGPRVAMGHSMGGHVLLRALTERRLDPEAAVLLSPMVRIRSPLGSWLSGRIARNMCKRGDPARAAWRPKSSAGARADADAMLTSDYGRLLDEQWWHARMPGTQMGPPSWSWLAEAFASSDLLWRRRDLSHLTTPLLFLLAEQDRLTVSRASSALARRLPNARVAQFKSAGHELLREVDPVRDAALHAIDSFLGSATARARGASG